MANKYDCTKALDYVHELKRMCKSIPSDGCEGCPLENYDCRDITETTEKHIDIVQTWSDEHPGQTRVEKLIELLKGTEFEKIELNVCALNSDDDCGQEVTVLGANYFNTESWWNEPYKEEKSCQ